MAFLAKFAASKYVGDKLEDNFGPENPKYHILINEDGRRKKIKKQPPPGLDEQDERVLQAVRRKAWRYEWWVDCHCCCGLHVQFGSATIWGLLPIVGDLVSLANALSLIRTARRVGGGGLPAAVLVPMVVWALVDFVIKLVPVAGDILTAIIKPNTRNCMRVEAFLRKRGEKNLRGAAAAGRGRGPGRGAARGVTVGVDEPLVVSAQPGLQSGMSPGAAYGTVSPAAGSGSGRAVVRERDGRSRHLLPFWRKNEDTDSEGEEDETRR
ncbi:hypothetical protein VP1G_09411 [Cytospora mali]|uniref:Uncharacterized protein n=1 Tax=Cytospora mali TaxID=578113 RepID=A0A194VEU0_CYTMA|nr:hypothetical protein VP1G_09411 [Valsa mali var. pyri (nom. inval.)]